MNTEYLLVGLQVAQLAGIVYGLVKIGRWTGDVEARLQSNDRDHARYERHLEQRAGAGVEA